MALLEVNNLSIGYDGYSVADNITFTVNSGDYLCIVGENGAGKSTLVKTLLHLQKPLAGTLEYDEKGIGYLPQQTVVQRDFPASVSEIVMSGNLAKKGLLSFYTSKDRERAKENMKRMGIWELRKKSYRNLSGGQQQRVLLARALCASSRILFLDEPVTGLDPKVTAEFYSLLKEINAEGVTVIMVSHDMQAAQEYASHILHIGKSNVFFGTKQDYANSEIEKELQVEER